MTALPEFTLDLSTVGPLEWEVTQRPFESWCVCRGYSEQGGEWALVATLLLSREQWQGLLCALRAHDEQEPPEEYGEGGGASVTELRAIREAGR